MKVRIVLALWLAASLGCVGLAAEGRERSQAAKDEFKRGHPCPSTGENRGPCPGYVIDHIKALDCGGADEPGNMQWQSEAEGKAKDKWERNGCHAGTGPTEPARPPTGECGGKSTCGQMSSCAEARHYLKDCGVTRLDRDGDGIPCESLCK